MVVRVDLNWSNACFWWIGHEDDIGMELSMNMIDNIIIIIDVIMVAIVVFGLNVFVKGGVIVYNFYIGVNCHFSP
ncbi:hypothetical protein Hanom_Chr13g01244501 [Helianthus anomalus]